MSDERRASFRWSQSIMLSRAHSGDGKPLALVPGLDLLNHGGDDAGAVVRFDASAGAFDLIATRAHAPGEHLLIDYGTRASHRLLRLYGFVPSGPGGVGGDGDPASPVRDSVLAPGDEVLLPLLPSAAELAGACCCMLW